jgi:hypothetical protein
LVTVPLPAPKPVDALRQHTRAVVLISAEGDASPALLDAIRDSEVPCELIGHPVVAMAELVRLEHGDRRHEERTALFVADDERIEQLATLFQSVRVRLPQVAIWVVAGDLAVQVQRASAAEAGTSDRPTAKSGGWGVGGANDAGPERSHDRIPARRGAPRLRIVEPVSDDDRDAQPSTRHDGAHGSTDGVPTHPGFAAPRMGPMTEPKPNGAPSRGANHAGHGGMGDTGDLHDGIDIDPEPDEPEPNDHAGDNSLRGATRATSLTAEELDMLLGWDDGDDGAAPPGGRR